MADLDVLVVRVKDETGSSFVLLPKNAQVWLELCIAEGVPNGPVGNNPVCHLVHRKTLTTDKPDEKRIVLIMCSFNKNCSESSAGIRTALYLLEEISEGLDGEHAVNTVLLQKAKEVLSELQSSLKEERKV